MPTPIPLDAAYAGKEASRIKPVAQEVYWGAWAYVTKVVYHLVMRVSGRKRCRLPSVQLRLTSRPPAEMLGAECPLES